TPALPVDRPAVVGVDERPERELVALVDVRHARRGQLQHELSKRGAVAERREPGDELLERGDELAIRVQRLAELLDAGLPLMLLLYPVRVALGLAQRLQHVLADRPRRHSAPAAARSGRTPCPRHPWP